MRVWIGCLAAYNAGCLHGNWFDLEKFSEYEELESAIITQVIKTSPEQGEEWAVFDGDEIPSWLMRGLYPDLSSIWEYAEEYQRADLDNMGEIFAAWVEDGHPVDWDRCQDAYYCSAKSDEDFAWEYCESAGLLDGVPEFARTYFDFAQFGHDLTISGDFFAVDLSNGESAYFTGCY